MNLFVFKASVLTPKIGRQRSARLLPGLSRTGFVNRTQADPGFVNPVRSGPSFVNPILSGPVLVL